MLGMTTLFRLRYLPTRILNYKNLIQINCQCKDVLQSVNHTGKIIKNMTFIITIFKFAYLNGFDLLSVKCSTLKVCQN